MIAGLYKGDHIGVDILSSVLNTEELKLLYETFRKNTKFFLPLDFGCVTRWDLTEEDFCKFPELEIGRKRIKTITDIVTTVAKCNPKYKEKFSVLFYPEGSSGVKLHRDTEHSVNCVVIVVVQGSSPFCVAKDKNCKEVLKLPTKPGDIIIMRGPRNSKDALSRPRHYINQVTEPRYVMIHRQVNFDGLKK